MVSLRRVAAGLAAVVVGFASAVSFNPAEAQALDCAWGTDQGTLHGTAMSLAFFGDCASPTTLLADGAAVSPEFWHLDPSRAQVVVLDTTVLDPKVGQLTLALSADGATIATATFSLDNTAPTVSVLGPINSSVVHGVVRVDVSAQPGNAALARIAHVDAYGPDGVLVGSATSSADSTTWSVFLDTSGWTNGPFDLAVVAVQDDGNEQPISVTLVVKNPTTGLSITVAKATNYGQTSTITARLIDTSINPPVAMAGRVVELRTIPKGSYTPVRLASAQTASDGVATFVLTAKTTAQFATYFLGEKGSEANPDGYATSSSPWRTTTVSSTTTMKAATVKLARGQSFAATVTTAPGTAKLPLTIQVQSGSTWKSIVSTKTAGTTTKVGFSFTARGTYMVRAVRAADTATTGSTSAPLSLTVT